MNVSTTNYEFSHGHKPRGWGRWAFFFGRSDLPFWYVGKYSDAKKSAIAYAISIHERIIRVGE